MDTPASVRKYFQNINADRFEQLREIFSDDIEMTMAGSSTRRGVDAAVDYYPRALAPLPHHVDDPVAVVTSDDGRRCAVEIAFTGETADGRSVVFTAVDLFDLGHDGRIARLRSFYDTALVARLLAADT
jgi:ketosteroid isomerase-like protein